MITSKSKAETLNQKFQSVFTKEDNIPYIATYFLAIILVKIIPLSVLMAFNWINMEQLLVQTIYLPGYFIHVQLK